MPSSNSYSVNSKVKLPQPHIDYPHETSSSETSWTKWFLFSLIGVAAVSLILCLNLLGGKKLFLIPVDPTAGLVPIVHKDSFAHLLEGYPREHGTAYSNCWLENPSAAKPCFFESSWVTELCTSNFSYGYEEDEGHYNPCLILSPEGTKEWIPRLTESQSEHHDYGFIPVSCTMTSSSKSNATLSVFPSKGFARQFFPASRFNSSMYLPPLVAVRVNGMHNSDVVVVRCSIITPNAFILRNNGRVSITFSAE